MKKLIIVLSSIIGIYIAIACSDGGFWEESSNTIFSSDYFLHESLRPFFYSPEENYVGGLGGGNDYFNDEVLEDWYQYLDKKMTKDEVRKIIFSSTESEINALYNALKEGKSSSNKALEKIEKQKAIRFLQYMANSKHAETYAVNPDSTAWDYEEFYKKFKPSSDFEKTLINLFQTTEDKFLKQRYLFQIARYQYKNNADASIFFDQYDGKFDKNLIYYRTLSYVAGSLRKVKNYSKANYYYSLVFENSSKLSTIAHLGFHPQEESDWSQTLKMAKSNQEKITLWAMVGIVYQDQCRSLSEIYKLDKQSKYLELLATRYVIGLDDNMYHYYRDEDEESKNQKESNKLCSELIYQIANTDTSKKVYYWNELAAYASLHKKEYDKTTPFIQKAKATIPQKEVDISLVRLLEFIHRLAMMKTISADDEKFLLSELKWLKDTKHDKNFLYSLPLDRSITRIAEIYRSQGDLLKAECYRTTRSYYMENDRVVAMQNFINKKNKTPYETLMHSLYQYNLDNTYEHQAILFALRGDLKTSLNMSKKMTTNIMELRGNPFNNNIKDCHDCDHEAYKGKPYTMNTLLEKMIQIQSKIDSGIDVYQNSILLGNAYYNITHYGNARVFSEGVIMGSYYTPFEVDSLVKPDLLSMKNAVKFYLIALKNTSSDEQKAKIYFMLAKCERNEWYNKEYLVKFKNDWDAEDSKVNFIAFDNFKILKNYAHTKYAQEVLKECGYFISYFYFSKK